MRDCNRQHYIWRTDPVRRICYVYAIDLRLWSTEFLNRQRPFALPSIKFDVQTGEKQRSYSTRLVTFKKKKTIFFVNCTLCTELYFCKLCVWVIKTHQSTRLELERCTNNFDSSNSQNMTFQFKNVN